MNDNIEIRKRINKLGLDCLRKTVEEHIVTDLKIEARCKEIMANYEQRIQFLELAVDTKCDETRVREPLAIIIKNSCCKEIKLNQNDKLLIGLIYRSPSNNTKEYNDKLTELISEATQKGFSHILIMGDFNYPAIDWEIWNTKGENENSIENRFLDSIQENFLFQHTIKPTRWRGTDTPHTLDLILTNEEEMISNLEYMSPLGKSDHCVLSFDYNCYINIKNKPRIAKLTKIRTNKKMTQIGKKKNAFPVDKKTRELIKRKNILSKKIVTNQDPEIRAEYNRVRNKTKSSVNKLKKKFEKGLSENAKANPKAIWSYVKSKSKTREGIGDLHTDPDDTKSPKTDDDKEKAEILSEYFASVFTQEPDGEIPVPNSINIANELTELKINKDMIMKHLKKLKIDKSPGPDKLHPRLLRETMESIAEPLSLIFNQSLNEKTVPKEWKNALVSAIFKKGNKSQAKNYRPVSLTSVVCKILEKIIREHIIKHMKLNRLFSNKQYGFISGRSTSLQLLEVIDKWTEAIDDGYEAEDPEALGEGQIRDQRRTRTPGQNVNERKETERERNPRQNDSVRDGKTRSLSRNRDLRRDDNRRRNTKTPTGDRSSSNRQETSNEEGVGTAIDLKNLNVMKTIGLGSQTAQWDMVSQTPPLDMTRPPMTPVPYNVPQPTLPLNASINNSQPPMMNLNPNFQNMQQVRMPFGTNISNMTKVQYPTNVVGGNFLPGRMPMVSSAQNMQNVRMAMNSNMLNFQQMRGQARNTGHNLLRHRNLQNLQQVRLNTAVNNLRFGFNARFNQTQSRPAFHNTQNTFNPVSSHINALNPTQARTLPHNMPVSQPVSKSNPQFEHLSTLKTTLAAISSTSTTVTTTGSNREIKPVSFFYKASTNNAPPWQLAKTCTPNTTLLPVSSQTLEFSQAAPKPTLATSSSTDKSVGLSFHCNSFKDNEKEVITSKNQRDKSPKFQKDSSEKSAIIKKKGPASSLSLWTSHYQRQQKKKERSSRRKCNREQRRAKKDTHENQKGDTETSLNQKIENEESRRKDKTKYDELNVNEKKGNQKIKCKNDDKKALNEEIKMKYVTSQVIHQSKTNDDTSQNLTKHGLSITEKTKCQQLNKTPNKNLPVSSGSNSQSTSAQNINVKEQTPILCNKPELSHGKSTNTGQSFPGGGMYRQSNFVHPTSVPQPVPPPSIQTFGYRLQNVPNTNNFNRGEAMKQVESDYKKAHENSTQSQLNTLKNLDQDTKLQNQQKSVTGSFELTTIGSVSQRIPKVNRKTDTSNFEVLHTATSADQNKLSQVNDKSEITSMTGKVKDMQSRVEKKMIGDTMDNINVEPMDEEPSLGCKIKRPTVCPIPECQFVSWSKPRRQRFREMFSKDCAEDMNRKIMQGQQALLNKDSSVPKRGRVNDVGNDKKERSPVSKRAKAEHPDIGKTERRLDESRSMTGLSANKSNEQASNRLLDNDLGSVKTPIVIDCDTEEQRAKVSDSSKSLGRTSSSKSHDQPKTNMFASGESKSSESFRSRSSRSDRRDYRIRDERTRRSPRRGRSRSRDEIKTPLRNTVNTQHAQRSTLDLKDPEKSTNFRSNRDAIDNIKQSEDSSEDEARTALEMSIRSTLLELEKSTEVAKAAIANQSTSPKQSLTQQLAAFAGQSRTSTKHMESNRPVPQESKSSAKTGTASEAFSKRSGLEASMWSTLKELRKSSLEGPLKLKLEDTMKTVLEEMYKSKMEDLKKKPRVDTAMSSSANEIKKHTFGEPSMLKQSEEDSKRAELEFSMRTALEQFCTLLDTSSTKLTGSSSDNPSSTTMSDQKGSVLISPRKEVQGKSTGKLYGVVQYAPSPSSDEGSDFEGMSEESPLYSPLSIHDIDEDLEVKSNKTVVSDANSAIGIQKPYVKDWNHKSPWEIWGEKMSKEAIKVPDPASKSKEDMWESVKLSGAKLKYYLQQDPPVVLYKDEKDGKWKIAGNEKEAKKLLSMVSVRSKLRCPARRLWSSTRSTRIWCSPGQPGYGAPPPGQPGYPGGQPGYPAAAPQPGYGQAPGGYGAGPPPGIDPSVYQWFLTVDQDKSGHITAHELQQALVNGNWSHFNPETCRLMISMFDRDNTGTIQLHEFNALWNYIQQWKGVFERFDGNHSGSIEAHELIQAFQQMGYNLSPQFGHIVISKFDVNGRRSLTLDNFIQSCVMLKSLTDSFKERDPQMQGTIRMGYEDFMTTAVFNKV
ncbi:Peflin,Programmed cell death protein 6,Sorcin [Mytilus edulis]|uniref:Peflin,Programmed cell death protein 6,Sorcin n=2 Tax=Mytilus TaxID=6548 RepID=A0A8S3Q9F1_MYTED|nr:Peflin,Programmed cell death protein 6,Sorcin [Mytilus edulis]